MKRGDYMIKVLRDEGGEVTSMSMAFWTIYKDEFKSIHEINIHFEGKYNMEILGFDKNGVPLVMLLSGFGCGYKGTAPDGTEKVLREIIKDVMWFEIETLEKDISTIYTQRDVHIVL